MPKRKHKVDTVLHAVTMEKLVHGGQGMGRLPDGRAVFVWNALPGEEVLVRLTRSKKDFAEGFAVEVSKASPKRVDRLATDDIRLSTQPWAIMDYDMELAAKTDILQETFAREGLQPEFRKLHTKGPVTGYRNKVEFSFYGDESGLHYAHYLRASHQKIILEYPYNDLIAAPMAEYAKELLARLRKLGTRASELKSVIIRSESSPVPKVTGALFVKADSFPDLGVENLAVYYSNPKSPASLPTKKLYEQGTTKLRCFIIFSGKLANF
jgi:23S rRNA (uracil1939-C5)-methyltransferase